MKIKNIIDEDFTNYKKPSMFIAFPYCTFKCDRECGKPICQNSDLAYAPNIEIETGIIIQRYLNNPITSALVLGGLEPFDSFGDMVSLIYQFRLECDDDIIIYTGYVEDEIFTQVIMLKEFKNIIIKFGRYIPNSNKHYSNLLGIELASDNQYAVKIS